MKIPNGALAVVMLGGVLSAQQVWKVNCQGLPGVHFTDLPAAVAAASPGDEIWVYYDPQAPLCPGNPNGYYTAPIITKPLRIVGFGVGGGSGPMTIGVRGQIVVLGIGGGQRVLLNGLQVLGVSVASPAAIVALDCQGDVMLENVIVDNDGGPTTFVHFERCNNVVLRGCDFMLGGYPLTAIDSSVLLTTSAVSVHAPFSAGPPFAYAATTEGIRVINSTVTAIGSLIEGASNATSIFAGYLARPAVVVESGVFRTGPATTLRGGMISPQPWPLWTYGFQVLNPAIGQVRQDSRGTIVNPPPTPVVVYEAIPATYHSWVVANETFGVTVAGPPSGFALLMLGEWQPGTPSPLGPLAMDPAAALPIALVPLSLPSGYFQWTLTCPLTAPVARGFALQALTIAPTGALGVSVPSPLMVGWPHGVIP